MVHCSWVDPTAVHNLAAGHGRGPALPVTPGPAHPARHTRPSTPGPAHPVRRTRVKLSTSLGTLQRGYASSRPAVDAL
ncbi:unnamed protein product [Plutella xylostella]|uniref:(diamondback moth) hypothetical protein n=1 Tax=Plutella xylostella TaxID=51655 RepID=A0A8S4F5X6_PLUXY|nr:unnamed protein product [Plutella xylostella]